MYNDKVRVLLIEPDEQQADSFGRFFSPRGWVVEHIDHTESILSLVDEDVYHLIFISLNLQDEQGLSLCKQIRYMCSAGIVILHELDDPAERVLAYEHGADAYFVKPLAFREMLSYGKNLISRVNIALNTKGNASEQEGWTFSEPNKTLSNVQGVVVTLSKNETTVLQMFINNVNESLSRERLLIVLGRKNTRPGDRSLDMLISKLRNKLKAVSGEPNMIVSQYGHGYIFKQKTTAPAFY